MRNFAQAHPGWSLKGIGPSAGVAGVRDTHHVDTGRRIQYIFPANGGNPAIVNQPQLRTPAETQQGLAELRKGIISLAVMLNLRQENHGYAVRMALSRNGLPLKEGTLYPLLRRLEAQGVLAARWDTTGDRMRKFYSLTESGSEALKTLQQQWCQLVEIVRAVGEGT